MSADGKIATANRAVTSFSSQRDHDELLRLRATADAVMCGSKTAGALGVTLGVGGAPYRRMRIRRGLAADHLRVIVSSTGGMDPAASLFRCESSPVLVLISRRASTVNVTKLSEVATDVIAFGNQEVDLPAALRWLRQCRGVKRLICEGGGELNDSMIRAGLVDELRITLCPLVIGGRSAPTISDGRGFSQLAQAAGFRLRSVRRVGDEVFLKLAR